MRAVLQRVSRASVSVNREVVGDIGSGLLIFICAMQDDDQAKAYKIADKILKMRIFKDHNNKMNLSLLDIGGEALIVSQFTLAGDLRGNRPGFSTAAAPEKGKELYEHFIKSVQSLGVRVATGIFGADMDVSLHNDGPVTIWVDL